MQEHHNRSTDRRRPLSLIGERAGKEQHGLGLFSLGTREAWTRQAACRDEDPEMFFPEHPTRGSSRAEHRAFQEEVQAAKRFCVTRCPVLEQCLVDAVRRGDMYGIRAGYDFSLKEERDDAKHRVAGESRKAS